MKALKRNKKKNEETNDFNRSIERNQCCQCAVCTDWGNGRCV